MTRCPSCPAPLDATCLAHATGHTRFCEWAAKGGIHREHVRANSHVGTPVATRQRAVLRPPGRPGTALAGPLDEWTFVTTQRLVADTHRLMASLPADIDLVAAIPRSGLLPGSLLAFARHIPLVTVSRQSGVVDPGHGGRMESMSRGRPRHVLLIDDTAATGREMLACLPIVQAAYPGARITRAVVYCHPRALATVDVCVSTYPGQHYLEHNFHNAGHGSAAIFDMDGIICRDFTEAECKDFDTYSQTMTKIEPLFLPRRTTVPMIVTARPESTRSITLEWLARWGVKVDRLVMKDWETDHSRDWNTQIGEWKASRYASSHLGLFIESDKDQAKIIAERTGKATLCPALERVIPPRPVPLLDSKLIAAIEACNFRISLCGCLGKPARCNLAGYSAVVSRSDCERCLSVMTDS